MIPLRALLLAASWVPMAAAAFAVFATANPACARSFWLLPSSTVLASSDKWVTVDGGASTAPFEDSKFPLELEQLRITAPDGADVLPHNVMTGALRSVFDVPLAQRGTYRLAVLDDSAFAIWKDAESGEDMRWRGPVSELAHALPDEAQALQIGQMRFRTEVFITVGEPSPIPAAPHEHAGKGLELVPVTHPNDLVPDEEAQFLLLINGEPAADLEVTLTPSGFRWRDDAGLRTLKTDAHGLLRVTWPAAGQYLLYASANDTVSEADSAAATQPAAASPRQLFYAATLEVLP